MKFWLQHCFSELLNISRSIFISLDNLVLLSGVNNLFTTQVFALRFELRSNRVKSDSGLDAGLTLFNDFTRDSIANNFVIDVSCRCLPILYQIAFFYKI